MQPFIFHKEVIKAPGPHELSPYVHSLSHKENKRRRENGEGCATSPSGYTTMLSRKKLREPETRDLFSWKIKKPLLSWSCAYKRRERLKRRRIATQPDQVRWSFWEIMEQGNASIHVIVFSSGHWWWNWDSSILTY
jgi:hypothetical protein